MSSMKDLTPAIMSAAIGIMAGYSTVTSAETLRGATDCVHEQTQEDVKIASAIHTFIKACEGMETRYRATVKEFADVPAHELASVLTPQELSEFTNHIQELRNIEVLLKNFDVPEQFSDLHLRARKALAKGRSWVVILHDMTIQSLQSPEVEPGLASGEGLKALASHTTKRLVDLAVA